MATRCGALDPGVLLHLLGPGGISLNEMEDILYHRSGLLGVSGISADSRVLLESGEAGRAREAIDLFTFRSQARLPGSPQRWAGSTPSSLQRALAKTSLSFAKKSVIASAWLGIELDPAANAGNAGTISAASSRIAAFVIPTDEEQVIADETLVVLNG